MKKTLLALAMTGIVLTACGGGGSTPSPLSSIGLTPGEESAACEQEYFQTIIGNYTGTAEYAIRGEARCMWDISVSITGTPIVAMCGLNAQTEGNVTQFVFSPEGDNNPFECLNDSGFRSVREPISLPLSSGLEIPNLDNSHFPIEIQVDSNTTFDRGPYSRDESLTASYLQVFDGQTTTLGNIVIVEGDGTMTLRSSEGTFSGILLKDN